ncbi:MAG: hypothetical protein ACYC1T_00160 [Sulfuricaulis sp.]
MKQILFLALCAVLTIGAAAHDLPVDVQSFIDDRDGCDHFRGEPWGAGDDPEVKERREFIFENIKKLCTGTDKRLAELRNKYRNDPVVIERLRVYEDNIELQ